MTTAGAFDRVATTYDRLWTDTPVGRAQREQVWRDVDGLFAPGTRLLDVGCGTGADAAHFAGRGVSVLALDPSCEMIRTAGARGGFETALKGAADLSTLTETFDGALSNFGALNCVADLASFAADLAKLMKPGSPVAICIISRFCLWETIYYLTRLQFKKAFRRFHGRAASSLGMTVYYPSVTETARSFSADFLLQRWVGIGVLVPPSYVGLTAAVNPLSRLDRWVRRIPLLRAMGDHRLLIFVRK